MQLSRPIPPEFRPLRLLREEAESLVLHAQGPGGDVVLRVGCGRTSGAERSELAVLAAVDVPGLAGLVGFGRVEESGDPWTARRWIPGVELGKWALDRDSERIGELIARLCPGLHELHSRGFVHADLKPENIIVTPAGEPVLTDFGLSVRGGQEPGGGGSLFYAAPEVLLGRPAEPSADLFALGVLLHELLVGQRASAQQFYAKFPSASFFEATETSPEDLPEWARGVVARLLERDPSLRPSSALVLADDLRSVLGDAARSRLSTPEEHVLNWSSLSGRKEWWDATLALDTRVIWTSLPDGEDAAEMAEALRLRLALRGGLARLPLREEMVANPEAFIGRLSSGAEPECWLVPVTDEASRRAFEYVSRAVGQRTPRGDDLAGSRLVALASASLEPLLEGVQCLQVPAVDAADMLALLEPDFEGDLDSLARELSEAGGGSVARATRVMQGALQRGEFVVGLRGFKRRPGSSQALEEVAASPSLELSRAEARVVAAAGVTKGEGLLEDLRGLAKLDEEPFARAVKTLCARGVLRWRKDERGVRLVPLGAQRPIDEWIDLPLARSMYAAWARVVSGEDRALCRFAARADRNTTRAAFDLIARAQERGDLARALELAERLQGLARTFAPSESARAAGEVASAWAALGVPERAEAILRALESEGEGTASVEAVVARVRGRLAHLRHDFAEAQRQLLHASELEPDDGGESLFRTALLLFDSGRDAELADCLRRARGASLDGRFAWSLEAIEAMAALRRGDHEQAAGRLQAQLEETLRSNDEQREALVRNNLALLDRRAGRFEDAADQLIRAAQLQERLGMLPALAQSRAMLGATRREQGALHEAEALLRSASQIRERLGDTSGALAARGMLGLAFADSGRLRAAADELSASVQALDRAGRSADSALLGAKLREVQARFSEAPDRAFAEEPQPDPRVLLCHARAAALWGDQERALDYAARGAALAGRLGLQSLVAEIRGLERLLEGELPDVQDGDSAVFVDRTEALRHLFATPDAFDAALALECARRLGFRGRTDLAARMALAVVARAEERPLREEARRLAREWLGLVERGLTSAQAERARASLLGVPDPWPEDLQLYDRSETSDDSFDMDIISLLDINHRLVAQEDLPSLLGEIVESALSVTRAERGFLVLEQDGELEFDTARHSRRGDLVEPESEISRSILSKVLESGVTLRLSNATDDPLLGGAPSVAQLELRSILIAPFDIAEGLRGAIYVDHRLREGAFSERAEQLLDLLAGQAALAIRQARRMQEIRELNRQLNKTVIARDADLATARKALKEAGAVVPSSGLVGSSEAMQRVHLLIERCASTELPVLVSGPSGSGKELAARALHAESPRKEGAFISENCAALPPSLIESELFGYVKGAFTGADRDHPGLFERAHGGTLFLDEIGELPLELQAKLLRALETGEIRRVGASRVRTVDFRLVAATNRDLHAEAAEGRFRADLVYRLDALRVEMPALSARTEDLPELVEHFLELEAARSGGDPRKLAPAVLDALSRRDWPGNVRELANEISRLCVLSEGDIVDASLVRPAHPTPAQADPFSAAGELPSMAELERRAIHAALERANGDKRRAAEMLGISRAKIYQRLKEWADAEA